MRYSGMAVRPFRIVDGADEVHKRTVAREAFADVDEAELDPVTRFGEWSRSQSAPSRRRQRTGSVTW